MNRHRIASILAVLALCGVGARSISAAPLSDVDPHLRLNPLPVLPWGKDPFSEKETGALRTAPSAPGVVSAIFFYPKDPGRSMAILEGRIVRVGDEIGGRRVLEIDRNKVVVADQDNVVELKLTEASVSKEEKGRFDLKVGGAGPAPKGASEEGSSRR